MDHFDSVAQLLARKTTDTPVFCFFPQRFRAAARRFVTQFPGEVLYAVKANSHPLVLQWLIEGGIQAFDTASLAEIELVRQILPGAHCSFNHPVKPRLAILAAWRDLGIRDFVIDHPAELDKLLTAAGPKIVIQVRVAAQNPHATISFNSKFGASPQQAVALLRAISERGATPALCTHIGYQTTDPAAYAQGLRLLADVAATAGVPLSYINIGGGFPSLLLPAGQQLEDYFAAIGQARRELPGIADLPLKCEPGSALTHSGGVVLTQVVLVKEQAVHINDGVYGAMAEMIHVKAQPPTRVIAASGVERSATLRPYTVFGPTCDSYDVMPARFMLPESICEGDWLVLEMMGAYSNVLISDFNGLGAHQFAIIGD
jgi:ornithine decarboxylase